MRHTNVSLRQAGMINLFQALDFILSRISALSEGRFPLVLCSSLNMLDDDAGVHTLFFPLTPEKIRFRLDLDLHPDLTRKCHI
ncbi:hypothetical protein TNCV_2409601 [Trichonephila clavipes]|nr:hypothetical protein TNCV_2409601 [Trichonephila clavipes]